jgi:hypothetical protein
MTPRRTPDHRGYTLSNEIKTGAVIDYPMIMKRIQDDLPGRIVFYNIL